MFRKYCICCLFVMAIGTAEAQLDAQFSQHMLNRMNYNPAVTGASSYITICGYIRDQWSGWKGAPRSRMLTAHNYFDRIASGMGLTVINDEIGLENSLNIKFSYAYHVALSENSYLSLGLSGGILHRYLDREKLFVEDYTDENLPLDIKKKVYADFDFGVEFNYSDFTLGASVTHITASKKQEDALTANRHYYAFMKYRFPVSYRWKLEPSLFMQNNKPFFHSEISLLAYYNRLLWIGSSFRVDADFRSESFVPIAGIEIAGILRLSYSFDVNLGDLRNYTSGTHELLLSIRIRKNPLRYSKSPRFFE